MHDQVNMVAHQAESMDTMAVSFNPFLKQKEHFCSICRWKENIPATVTAKHNVIHCAGKMNTRFTSHAMMTISKTPICQAWPYSSSIALESGKLPMPEWQRNELDKRYDHYKQFKLELHDWQKVHHELRDRYKWNYVIPVEPGMIWLLPLNGMNSSVVDWDSSFLTRGSGHWNNSTNAAIICQPPQSQSF